VSAALRVGNASGFYGDRFAAVREMLTGGELDVLTGDYLAELTMLILGRDRLRDPALGYARTFLRQMEDCLGLAVERGVRIVSNAGGLNPAGLADALRRLADRLGVSVRVAHVEGDDVLARAAELGLDDRPEGLVAANVYLGAFGIAECLRAGADIVVAGRVTDASLVVGPAAAHFGWTPDDLDQLAGAVVAGHVLECGTQATGGNFAFFTEILTAGTGQTPGFPLAEIQADGSSVITKHPGTGGAVTVETVTAQLLYEIDGPRYPGPDVTTRFDTMSLRDEGPDRVGITGVRGEPPPPTAKVCRNAIAGWRNEVTFVLTGLDIEAKAELAEAQFREALGKWPADLRVELARTDHPDATTEATASALLRITGRDTDRDIVGKAFSRAAVELALASYPGCTLIAPPAEASVYGVYTASYVDQSTVEHVAVVPDGARRRIPPPARTAAAAAGSPGWAARPAALVGSGSTVRAPLGEVAGARSGDKGGTANIGVWARSAAGWRWLARFLTADTVRHLLPEAAPLPVTVHRFANLRAVNVVIEGMLGEGVAASTRFDPQGKGLGEWLRSRYVDIPVELL
jgi:hypothetical protein